MATRGIIGRKTLAGFTARYHHWDSYPKGLGDSLYTLYHEHFSGDITAMMHVLVDEHPAGWSSINECDFRLSPGFTPFTYTGEHYDKALYEQQYAAYEQSDDAKRPQCYCHGNRHEDANCISSFQEAIACGAEYVYIIDEHTHTMAVWERESALWKELTCIDFRIDPPIWTMLR